MLKKNERMELMKELQGLLPNTKVTFSLTQKVNQRIEEGVAIKANGTAPVLISIELPHSSKQKANRLKFLYEQAVMMNDFLMAQADSAEYIYKNVKFQICNSEINAVYLDGVIYFPMADLAAVCYIEVEAPDGETVCMDITPDMFDHFGLEEESLKKAAAENTWGSTSLYYYRQWYRNGGTSPEEKQEVLDILEKGLQRGERILLTNMDNELGAGAILCDTWKQHCRQDMYIVFCNRSEAVLLPATGTDPFDFAGDRKGVFIQKIGYPDYLSENVYYYNHSTQKMYEISSSLGRHPMCEETEISIEKAKLQIA